jgi:hypothetical protein
MDDELRDALEPGEPVLWEGKPKQGLMFRPGAVVRRPSVPPQLSFRNGRIAARTALGCAAAHNCMVTAFEGCRCSQEE